MATLTDVQLQAAVSESGDNWLSEGKRGEGKLMLRVQQDGTKRFYYRMPVGAGSRAPVPIGPYDPKGIKGYSLKTARVRFNELEAIRRQHGDPIAYLESEAARKAAEQRQAEVQAAQQGTFGELMAAYVDYLKGEGKADTASAVENLFRLHVRERAPDLIPRKAVEITPVDIHRLLSAMAKEGLTRQVNKLRSFLLAAFNYAAKAAYDPLRAEGAAAFGLESNPVAITRRVSKFERQGERALNSTELAAYLKHLGEIENKLVREFVRTAIYLGGQRLAQLARLKDADISEESQTIRLQDSKGRSGVARDHLLPLTPRLNQILSAVPKVKHEEKEGADTLPGWVFTHNGKVSLRPETVSIAVTKYAKWLLKKHKIKPFTARDIRRTCETRLAELGVTKDIRAQLLSHGITGVQAKHYDRYAYLKEKHEALDRWAEYLDGLLDPDSKVVPLPERKRG